jgi:transposase
MQGKPQVRQRTLFVVGCLDDLVPEDHILKRVDGVLDLSWLAEEVRACYCEDNGRPSIPPEAALRLMLAGVFHAIVSDRKLIKEAEVNLAIRWFAGYGLEDRLPDHSTLTRIRQRWGAERFKRIFLRVVRQCVDAGLVSGETLHIDATQIRANVSWEAVTAAHMERVLDENGEEESEASEDLAAELAREKGKKRCLTDPDATLSTAKKGQPLQPNYKQHTTADGACGVVVDVEVTTGASSESRELVEQVERAQFLTRRRPRMVTADAGYGHGRNYAALEERGIEPVIKPQRDSTKSRGVPLSRFRYDPQHQRVRCPKGKVLLPQRTTSEGTWYSAASGDCQSCTLCKQCVAPTSKRRTILIRHGYDALLRARRRRGRWNLYWRQAYSQHFATVEGIHGEAKGQHGLRRAARRGLANMQIQAYLTAMAINLKRLAKYARPSIIDSFGAVERPFAVQQPFLALFSVHFANSGLSNAFLRALGAPIAPPQPILGIAHP